jgi:hypothetical protein
MRYICIILRYVGGTFNLLHLSMIMFYMFANHTLRWHKLTLFPFTFLFCSKYLVCIIRAALKIRMVPIMKSVSTM